MALDSPIRIGVDVGGTKVLCAAFDTHNKPIAYSQVSTHQGEKEIVDEVCNLISKVIKQVNNGMHQRLQH